jgi:hypothetical protein
VCRYAPIHLAADNANLRLVLSLVLAGCALDEWSEEGQTPLCLAIDAGSTDVAEVLISRGADVNKGDRHGRRPLHYAAKRAMLDVSIALLRRGGDAEAPDGRYRRTPLHTACAFDALAVAECLVHLGRAHVDARDANGDTPLHLAASYGSAQCVRFLLRAGASSRALNRALQTPFESADRAGHAALARAIRSHPRFALLLLLHLIWQFRALPRTRAGVHALAHPLWFAAHASPPPARRAAAGDGGRSRAADLLTATPTEDTLLEWAGVDDTADPAGLAALVVRTAEVPDGPLRILFQYI